MEYDSVIGNNEAALTEKNISKIHCVAEIIKVEKSVNSGLQFEYKTYTYKHILRMIHEKLSGDCLCKGS